MVNAAGSRLAIEVSHCSSGLYPNKTPMGGAELQAEDASPWVTCAACGLRPRSSRESDVGDEGPDLASQQVRDPERCELTAPLHLREPATEYLAGPTIHRLAEGMDSSRCRSTAAR